MNKGFSSRNSEILTTLKLGLDLLEKFSSSYTPPDFQKTVRSIVARGDGCFQSLVKATSYLYGNSPGLYAEILTRMILHKKNIRCVPVVTYEDEIDLLNFCLTPDEDGIFIENPERIAERAYFQDPAHNQPCLLVQKEILDEDLKFAVEDYCKTHNIPLQNLKKTS